MCKTEDGFAIAEADLRECKSGELTGVKQSGRNKIVDEMILIKDKVTLTVTEAAEYSNIGINKLESLLRDPRCPFVLYVGKKKLVKRKEFEKFISDNAEI